MIIVVTGPTAVGKTTLSVKLAKYFNAEIINADSVQFYKGFDIGSAKVKEEEKEGVPHHLFDIVEANEMFSIYDYQQKGRALIKELTDRGKNVVIVGGSGLYIKALLYNYELKEDSKTHDFSDYTNEELLSKIKEYEPATLLHVNNRKRLERRLSKLLNNDIDENLGNEAIYDFKAVGLTTDKKTLYDKINKRVRLMLDEGLVEEVKDFYDRGIHSKAIETAIGYKELYKYFDGELNLDEALELIAKNSRRYAKRQYTFFKHQMDLKWFETNYDNFDKTVNEVITYLEEDN